VISINELNGCMRVEGILSSNMLTC